MEKYNGHNPKNQNSVGSLIGWLIFFSLLLAAMPFFYTKYLRTEALKETGRAQYEIQKESNNAIRTPASEAKTMTDDDILSSLTKCMGGINSLDREAQNNPSKYDVEKDRKSVV